MFPIWQRLATFSVCCINMLRLFAMLRVLVSQSELDEALAQWKTRTHILRFVRVGKISLSNLTL